MANLENIKIVRDAIAKAVEKREGIMSKFFGKTIGFNMAWYFTGPHTATHDYVDSCNTTACLAGWTMIALVDPVDDPGSDPARYARELLGLSINEAKDMFEPFDQAFQDIYYDRGYPLYVSRFSIQRAWGSITAEQAVKMLDIYLETERVDWNAALGYNFLDRMVEQARVLHEEREVIARRPVERPATQDYPNA